MVPVVAQPVAAVDAGAVRAGRRPSIRFLGGVGTVTGSKFLLSTAASTVLIDCGLFQGHKELRQRNRAELPFDVRSLDAVVVTHAHIDHLGYLPALVRAGLRAPVHMTPGSQALAAVVLPDAGRLQEEEAAHANRVGSSRHHHAEPLFTEEDAVRALESIVATPFGVPVQVAPDVTVTFRRSGHILGSSWLLIEIDGFGAIAVSGDLGRAHHPLLLPPEPLVAVETVLVESTYGDRLQDVDDSAQQLADAITRTAARGGSVIIPSFAVDRTEVLLMRLRELIRVGAIPELPVFVDSPMALEALRAYRRAITERWPEIRPVAFGADDPFDTGQLRECRTVEESKAIAKLRYPSIIISASGMATGGRVLPSPRRPFARFARHHRSPGIPGRRNPWLATCHGGAPGEDLRRVHRRACRDHSPGGVQRPCRSGRARCLVVDGPRTASNLLRRPRRAVGLADAIHDRLGWRAIVPSHDELVLLGRRPSKREGVSP